MATAEDFVDKEHLTTVCVVVPRGCEDAFLNSYEKMDEFICPRSAKKFQKFVNGKMVPVEDKDGSTLWRVLSLSLSLDAEWHHTSTIRDDPPASEAKPTSLSLLTPLAPP